MPLGARRLKRRILVLILGLVAGITLISCGGLNVKKPPSGLLNRVLASQGVSAGLSRGELVLIDGRYDTIPRIAGISAGSYPGLMAISPTRNVLIAFDSRTNSVYAVNTASESNIGTVQLPGPTWSMVVPTSDTIGYAAVPSATVVGSSVLGAVDVMNLSFGSITTAIGVTNAQTVVSNSTGTQLLVFSNDSDSVTVLSPANAAPPVDLSCLNNPPNAVCTVIPGFSRPVYAVINGTTAYVLNCGAQCGGTQPASVQTLDLNTLTAGTPILVNGATYAYLSGTNLYVAGMGSPTGPLCSSLTSSINPTTAASYCGTLDIVDLTTMTDPYYNNPAVEIAIPDGYHDRMDMSSNGQLFVGSKGCTDIGNVGNPSGEVRGCLAIYNTTNNTLVIPPDNGDVTGLQSFSSRYIEYVAEGGYLRVYDTTKNILLINDYLPEGTINAVGYVTDAKAIDFF